jgi:hypothetical protein
LCCRICTHILDTKKYAEDCDRSFGGFFHHFPYFGMRSEIDSANLIEAHSRTQELALLHFGQESQFGLGNAQMSAAHCNPGCCGGASCGNITNKRPQPGNKYFGLAQH